MLFCFFCFHLFLLLILLLRSVARFIRWSSNKSCRFAHVRIQLGLVLHHVVGQRSSVAHSIAVSELSLVPLLLRSHRYIYTTVWSLQAQDQVRGHKYQYVATPALLCH